MGLGVSCVQMGSFPGGSAWAMAKDIGSGFLLVTERTLQRLTAVQMDQLFFEIDKQLRDVRSQQPDLADIDALRDRNRRIQRLTGGRRVIEAVRRKRRK